VSIVLLAILFWTARSQWQVYRERRQIEKIEQAGHDGLEAIERGDFERADRLFEPIRHLLNINAPGDEQHYAVAARESHILANLLLDSIDRKMTLVAEANERDRASLLGQGVLFDGIVLLPEVGDASLDGRLFVNDRPVQVLLGSKDELRSAGINEQGRYLLGVKLRSLERFGEEWILRVDPASTIAITSESALPVLGLGDAPDLLEIVRQQNAWRKKRVEGARP
jgi:hypothetical protein